MAIAWPASSGLGLRKALESRKDDAIRESRRALDLDLTMDASLEFQARTGEADQALTLIEQLLTPPGAVRVRVNADFGIPLSDLRYRWEWDRLRNNPRFQKILAGPEPKTVY